jgi:predicted DNA-binding transcriptional regulator AlpA
MTVVDFRLWLETLAAAEATIPARVVLERLPEEDSRVVSPIGDTPPDKLLTVQEAADRLGVDRRWIYRHSENLPFVRRLSAGTLRFSERGLVRWQESRR